MKIAIPTAQGKLSMHFGHCETFTLMTIDPQKKTITETQDLCAPPHEPGLLPRWLAEHGVNLVIAGGMGQRAQQLFAEQGINVIVGAPAQAADVLAGQYLAGTLSSGANLCDH